RVAALLGEVDGPPQDGGFGLSRREHPGGGMGAFLAGPASGVLSGPGPEREALAEALRGALDSLVDADVEVDNDELFVLHRARDGRDVFFLVNPTTDRQAAAIALRGSVHPTAWDPTTGDERPVGPVRWEGGATLFDVELP